LFIGKKMVSPRVADAIPQWLQNMLWYLIETMEVDVKKRVQLFELSTVLQDGIIRQRIIHLQQPNYHREYVVSAVVMVEALIVAIDTGKYCVLIMV